MMLRIACIAAFMAVLLLPDPSRAAQGPDELYAKGRYREAEAAYRKLDLENPTDLRYRYDRGCAAFQAGSLDEAAAAFTSVARRAQKGDLKFRALFNLGSTAYRKGDFAASRDAYREALRVKPDDPDARHNLELALKALRKAQDEKKGQEGRQEGGDDREQDGRSGESGRDGQKGEKGQDKDSRGKQSGDDREGAGGSQGKSRQDGQGAAGGRQQGQQPGQSTGSPDEGKQDLSGELKGRNIGSGSQGGGNPLEMSPAERVERARAEALLNNTRENRARARALHAAPGGPAPVGSGKEW
jgi:Ca-activated chloride channel family protein